MCPGFACNGSKDVAPIASAWTSRPGAVHPADPFFALSLRNPPYMEQLIAFYPQVALFASSRLLPWLSVAAPRLLLCLALRLVLPRLGQADGKAMAGAAFSCRAGREELRER
jgi:hypothetical protein